MWDVGCGILEVTGRLVRGGSPDDKLILSPPPPGAPPVPLTIDLPPDTLAALRTSAAEHGRTPAGEAAARLIDSLARGAFPGPAEPADWSGDPLADALKEKIDRLRNDPSAFAAGVPDPFVAALEAERAGGSATPPARDAA